MLSITLAPSMLDLRVDTRRIFDGARLGKVKRKKNPWLGSDRWPAALDHC